jgi:hypothetical protein
MRIWSKLSEFQKSLRFGRQKIKTVKKRPKNDLSCVNFDRQVRNEVFKFEGSLDVQWLCELFLFRLESSSLLQLRNFRSYKRCRKVTF